MVKHVECTQYPTHFVLQSGKAQSNTNQVDVATMLFYAMLMQKKQSVYDNYSSPWAGMFESKNSKQSNTNDCVSVCS